MNPDSSGWGSIAIGLLGIATVLMGATAVGGFEVATQFGIGRAPELNSFTREFLKCLFYVSVLSYVVAWGFTFHVIRGGLRWAKVDTLGLAGCVFVQSLCIAVAAMTVIHVSFGA